VTGVVAALIANYIINAIAEQIGSFTLALIAPLSSQ
jgi:ATP/ADP translocase